MDGVDANGIGSQTASFTYGPSTNCQARASEAKLLLGRDVELHLVDAADPRIGGHSDHPVGMSGIHRAGMAIRQSRCGKP